MIRFSCPKCQMVLQAASERAGAKVSCPKCKFQMQVPSVPPVAKVAPQPAVPTPDWLGDVRAEQRADQRPPVPTPTAAEAAPWYFTREGKRYGPYTTAQLKQFAGSGQLLPTDLVWKEGVEGWKPASAVKGLFAARRSPAQTAAQAHPSGSPANLFESLGDPNTRPLAQAKRRWHGLSPKVKLGIIGGAVAVPLLLVLLITILIAGKSRQQGGPLARNGGKTSGSKEAGKKGTVPLPDFSKVDYAVPDFSKVDYSKVPEGTKSKRVIENGVLDVSEQVAPEGGGRVQARLPVTVTIDGYEKGGEFIPHGRSLTHYKISKDTARSFGIGEKPLDNLLVQETYYFHGEEHGIRKEWYINGDLRIQGAFVNGKPQGKWITKYKFGGKLESESFFLGGREHGVATRWHRNGTKSEQVTFVDGVATGPYSAWWSNGTIAVQGAYRNNSKEGNWTAWYPDDGAVWIEAVFADDMRREKYVTHFHNGKIATERLYDEKGVLLASKHYNEKGELFMSDGGVAQPELKRIPGVSNAGVVTVLENLPDARTPIFGTPDGMLRALVQDKKAQQDKARRQSEKPNRTRR